MIPFGFLVIPLEFTACVLEGCMAKAVKITLQCQVQLFGSSYLIPLQQKKTEDPDIRPFLSTA